MVLRWRWERGLGVGAVGLVAKTRPGNRTNLCFVILGLSRCSRIAAADRRSPAILLRLARVQISVRQAEDGLRFPSCVNSVGKYAVIGTVLQCRPGHAKAAALGASNVGAWTSYDLCNPPPDWHSEETHPDLSAQVRSHLDSRAQHNSPQTPQRTYTAHAHITFTIDRDRAAG